LRQNSNGPFDLAITYLSSKTRESVNLVTPSYCGQLQARDAHRRRHLFQLNEYGDILQLILLLWDYLFEYLDSPSYGEVLIAYIRVSDEVQIMEFSCGDEFVFMVWSRRAHLYIYRRRTLWMRCEKYGILFGSPVIVNNCSCRRI